MGYQKLGKTNNGINTKTLDARYYAYNDEYRNSETSESFFAVFGRMQRLAPTIKIVAELRNACVESPKCVGWDPFHTRAAGS